MAVGTALHPRSAAALGTSLPVPVPRRSASGTGRRNSLSEAAIGRLPVYLRVLQELDRRGVQTVSSVDFALAAGVGPAMLRKDLSSLGSYGTRGVGYPVGSLLASIGPVLGMTQDRRVVIVGVGDLGSALAKYGGFGSRGFQIVALADADPALTGKRLGSLAISPAQELGRVIAETGATIGVNATPAAEAQQVCDALVEAGVTSILNFAPVVLSVPQHVHVRNVDLSAELEILAFHAQRSRPAAVAAEVGR